LSVKDRNLNKLTESTWFTRYNARDYKIKLNASFINIIICQYVMNKRGHVESRVTLYISGTVSTPRHRTTVIGYSNGQ